MCAAVEWGTGTQACLFFSLLGERYTEVDNGLSALAHISICCTFSPSSPRVESGRWGRIIEVITVPPPCFTA